LPGVPPPFFTGGDPGGGITIYPLDRLYQEVAYIAYHFHWPYMEVMEMDHRERHRWVDEIARINTRLNEISGEAA